MSLRNLIRVFAVVAVLTGVVFVPSTNVENNDHGAAMAAKGYIDAFGTKAA